MCNFLIYQKICANVKELKNLFLNHWAQCLAYKKHSVFIPFLGIKSLNYLSSELGLVFIH